MTGEHERSFRRSGRLVGTVGRPVVSFRTGPTPDAAFEALQGPCLIASNHRSVFDALAGMHAIGKYGHTARPLSASWLWENARLGRLLDSIGAIPLPSGRAALDAVDLAVDVLRGGDHVLMTPEGRVVPADERTGGVGPGHKIVSRIARAAGVPIVPVALVGTDDLWPIGAPRPIVRPWHRPVVGYGYGPPIHLRSDDHRENADLVMAGIAEVVEAIETMLADRATVRV
ncbi:MAG: lysophospholipid acyltransferase family protein [Actinomycetota bacterium]